MTSLYDDKGPKGKKLKRPRPSEPANPGPRRKAARTTESQATAGGDPSTVIEGGDDDSDDGHEAESPTRRINPTTHFRKDSTRRRPGRKHDDQQPPAPEEEPTPQPKAPPQNVMASEVSTRWNTEMGGMSIEHIDTFIDLCNSLSSTLGRRLLFMRTPDSDLAYEVHCQLGKVRITLECSNARELMVSAYFRCTMLSPSSMIRRRRGSHTSDTSRMQNRTRTMPFFSSILMIRRGSGASSNTICEPHDPKPSPATTRQASDSLWIQASSAEWLSTFELIESRSVFLGSDLIPRVLTPSPVGKNGPSAWQVPHDQT